MSLHRLAAPVVMALTAALLVATPAHAVSTATYAVSTAPPVVGRALDELPAAVLADLNGAERAALIAADPERGEETREVSVVRTESGRLKIDAITVAAGDASNVERLLDGQPSVQDASVAQPLRAFRDPGVPDQWALPRLRAPELRALQGNAGAPIVAVLDTGVEATHPDLDGVLVAGTNILTQGVGLPADGDGHGTHVSGIIGAEVGNGIGTEGLLSLVRIMPVKILDDQGNGWSSDAAQGVVWAVDHGADVINMSLGGPYDPALLTAVEYAESNQVTVVAAMGNEYTTGNATSYPAAYPSVLAVGATDSADARAFFSNTGAHIDVTAPGTGILSTYLGGWAYMGGTSMATPYAAAAAAAVHSKYPALTSEQVRSQLTSTAQDLGAVGFDESFGSGIIDPVKALTAPTPVAANALPTAPDNVRVTAAAGSLGVTWSAPNFGGASSVSSYRVTATDSTGQLARVVVAGPNATVSGLTNGTEYQVQVAASNDHGTGPASSAVTGRPRTTPGAPSIAGTSPGDGAIALTWRGSSSDGGSPITGYQVTARTANQAPIVLATSAGARTATLTGLVNGTTYELVVHAQNVVGFSAGSPSGSATPRAADPPPVAPVDPPVAPVDSPVAPVDITVTPVAPTAAVAPPSAPVVIVVPPTAAISRTGPSAPYLVRVTPGNGRATVSWRAPTTGGVVTGYRIALTRKGYPTKFVVTTGRQRGVTVLRLANGVAYSVRLQAGNFAGYSGYSRALAVVPRSVPGAPRSPKVSSGATSDRTTSVVASWVVPRLTGGAPIAGYLLRLRKVGATRDIVKVVTPGMRKVTFTGLVRKARYTVVVQARGPAGAGAISVRSTAAVAR